MTGHTRTVQNVDDELKIRVERDGVGIHVRERAIAGAARSQKRNKQYHERAKKSGMVRQK